MARLQMPLLLCSSYQIPYFTICLTSEKEMHCVQTKSSFLSLERSLKTVLTFRLFCLLWKPTTLEAEKCSKKARYVKALM